jgi:folate-binding protein YgfZ
MSESYATLLDYRSVIRLAGPDVRSFLQGIVTNDVTKVTAERAIWSAFLTPQGKFLHEFFLAEWQGVLLLDCERERLPDLLRRLKLYRLRSKVELADVSDDFKVVAFHGPGVLSALGLGPEPGKARAEPEGPLFVDPRLAGLGARAMVSAAGLARLLSESGCGETDLAAYDRLRIALGVPDGSRDLEVERSILLENGFDELGGIDWQKGCFMGQELTARTRYRGLVKKRLVPVTFDGPAPSPGTTLERDGREVGTLRSSSNGIALATLRIESLGDQPDGTIRAGDAVATPKLPTWLKLPAEPPG